MGDHPIISENREENQMLVPAILFKDQITSEFQRIYYTEDMMYILILQMKMFQVRMAILAVHIFLSFVFGKTRLNE